ncbi:MAG: hypothetical protein AAF563_23195 [Pseudomonadota bacterium]
MSPKPIQRHNEAYRTPDRTTRRLMRVAPAANDNRRPNTAHSGRLAGTVILLLLAAAALAALLI